MRKHTALLAVTGMAAVSFCFVAGAGSAQAAVATTTELTVDVAAVPVGATTGTLTYSAATKLTAAPYTSVTDGSYTYRVDGALQSGPATIHPTCGPHTVSVTFSPTAGSGLAGSSDKAAVTVDVVGGTCDSNRRPVRHHPPAKPCDGKPDCEAPGTPPAKPCDGKPDCEAPGTPPAKPCDGGTTCTKAPATGPAPDTTDTTSGTGPAVERETTVWVIQQPVPVGAPATGKGAPTFTA